MSVPVIARVIDASSKSAIGPAATTRPERITVRFSLMSSISRILWLTNSTAMPRAWISRTTPNRVATSRPVSAVVGSSMISSRGLAISARAIATSCRPDVGSVSTVASRSRCTPSLRTALLCMRAQCDAS